MKAKPYRKSASAPKRPSPSRLPLLLLAGGMLLLAAALLARVSSPQSARAATAYRPEEVAYARPAVAVHEMGDGAPIPFLPPADPQPEIQVPEAFYDFGSVGPQDVVRREFIIRNTGAAPLTISRAYTTCGCTTAELSATVIPPGQVATIDLVFDAGFHDAAGQTVRRGLIIENNDPDHSQAEIWIQARVRSN